MLITLWLYRFFADSYHEEHRSCDCIDCHDCVGDVTTSAAIPQFFDRKR